MPSDAHPTSALSRYADRVLAAFIYFTRLPLWRWRQPPRESYATVVEHWPLTGWLTGGVMAAVYYFGAMVLPATAALVLAIAARLLLTGAMHEDGLADFFDGFGGGGGDRQRILGIMKDSHIGTYGVLALTVWLALLFFLLMALPPAMAALAIVAADPYSKMLTAQMIQMMPYARTADTAKSRTVYRRPPVWAAVGMAVQGLAPLAVFIYFYHNEADWSTLVFLPALAMYFLYLLIWRRLHGYTGDCCGAVCLLVELAFYLALNLMIP